jgi:hypothetical protein
VNKFLVLSSWFLVLGSWFLVLGSWFLVQRAIIDLAERNQKDCEKSGTPRIGRIMRMKKTGFLIRAIRDIRGKDFYWSPSLTRRVGMFLVVRSLFWVHAKTLSREGRRTDCERRGEPRIGRIMRMKKTGFLIRALRTLRDVRISFAGGKMIRATILYASGLETGDWRLETGDWRLETGK